MTVNKLIEELQCLSPEQQALPVYVENGGDPSDMDEVKRVITKPIWDRTKGDSVCIEST